MTRSCAAGERAWKKGHRYGTIICDLGSQTCRPGSGRTRISNTAARAFAGAGRAAFSPETNHKCIIFPLHTHVMPDARLLARTLTHLSDVAFAGVTERNMAMVPDIMDRLVVELRRFQIAAADVAREAAAARSVEVAAHDLACVNAAMETLRTALVTRDAPEGRGRLIPRMHGPAELGHLFPAVLHGPPPGRSFRPSPGFREEKSPPFAAENHPTPFPPQNRSTDVPSIPAATETRNA